MAGEKSKGLRGDDFYRPPRYDADFPEIGERAEEFIEHTMWPDGVPPPRDLNDPNVLTGDKPGNVPDARRPLGRE